MQGERPRRLSERTVDFGLAAMEFCEALPRSAAGRHIGFRRPAAEVLQQPAASNQQPVKKDIPSASHWPLSAGCWLLRHFGAKRRPKATVCVTAVARRGGGAAPVRVARASVDDRQEHQHCVGAHPRQDHRGVGSMPTPKGRTGAIDGGALKREFAHQNAPRPLGLAADRWLLAAETLPTH